MELIVRNLSKKYGKIVALDELNLTIQPGMFGLLGPNGAGKTTFMRILTTLIPATSGSISYGDLNWSSKLEVRKQIGYLPQKFSLYKQIRVHEVLDHIAVLKGIEVNRKQIVESVIEKVNLTEHRDKKIGQLSGGMVRRVGIAQAILGNPRIIVVDEPTAGLDPEERIRFRKLLQQLSEDSIVILSTHIVEDIEATCDTAAILVKGNLIEHGSLSKIGANAEGKVWQLNVSKDDFNKLSDNLDVISSYRMGDNYQIRILSEKAPQDAVPVEPSLEDGYLYMMKGAV